MFWTASHYSLGNARDGANGEEALAGLDVKLHENAENWSVRPHAAAAQQRYPPTPRAAGSMGAVCDHHQRVYFRICRCFCMLFSMLTDRRDLLYRLTQHHRTGWEGE